MELIIIGLIAFCVIKVLAAISARVKEKRRAEEIARLKAEQARQREQIRRAKQNQAAYEREQIRQAKEIEKHEAMLRKHEEQIAKLEFKVSQAESDIEHWTEQLGSLYGLLDIAENNRASAVPGSKADETAQKKIITLTNRIRTAEKKLDQAKFDKEQAEKKLSA